MSNFERLNKASGLTPANTCIELAKLAKDVPGDEVIVEVGVYKARSTCYLGHGARHGNGAHVYGIDPWDLPGNRRSKHNYTSSATRNAAKLNVRKQGMGKYVTLIRGFSVDVAASWDGPKVGLLHIDGDHGHRAVRGDVLAWAPHLAPGAVVVFDDYATSRNPGVGQAVDGLVEEGVLQPVAVVHDRIGVTSLTSTAPVEQWLDDAISTSADDVIEALESVVPTPEEEQTGDSTEPEQPDKGTAEDASDVPVGEPIDLGENAPANEPPEDTGGFAYTEPEPAPQPSLPDPPPRAGAGSGRGPWIDYAVQVTSRPESHWATMSRAEIINELERMKVI